MRGGGRPRSGTNLSYRPPPPWPGITEGFDARCLCTWAYHKGDAPKAVYQVKWINGSCPVLLHASKRYRERS